MTLTAEGAHVLEWWRRILSEIEAAEDEFAQTLAHPRGKLRISLPVLGGPVSDVLAAFRRHYPDVELEVDFTDRLVDAIEDGYEAAIRTGILKDSRLTAKRLGTFGAVLVGSASARNSRAGASS